MRKTLIGLLLASVIATPAVADKGGKGKGGHHKEFKADRGGGKHWRGGDDDRGRGGWERRAFRAESRPVRVDYARWSNDDDDDRGEWKERRKNHREYLREVRKDRREAWREARKDHRAAWREARGDWHDDDRRSYVPARVIRYAPIERYYEPRAYAPAGYARPVIRHAQPLYRPANYGSSYGYADPYDSYGAGYSPYGTGQGLFGGGSGLLSALLPIVLSSVIGGDLGSSLGGLTSLGGLGGIDGLTGLGGLGGLTNTAYAEGYSSPIYGGYDSYAGADYGDYGAFSDYGSYAAMSELTGADPYAVPLQQIGYGDQLSGGLLPASYGVEGGIGALLVPALLGQSSSLF